MTKRSLSVAAAFALALLAQAANGGPADWPTLLHDPARTGRQPVAGDMVDAPRIVASYALGGAAVGPIGYYDLDGDGASEALFLIRGVFSAQSRAGKPLWSAERMDDPNLIAYTDLDGDGKPEFLIYTSPSAVRRPRLVVLSPTDGRVRLSLETEPRASRFFNYKLGKLLPGTRGQQFFAVVKLEKPGTGNLAGGWACMVAFDGGVEKGRILWSKETWLAASYPKILTGDVNGDGKPELISVSHQHVTAFDPATGNEAVRFQYGEGRRNYGFIQAVNLDREPDDELVVLTDESFPHMEVIKLGGHPRVVWHHSFVPENYEKAFAVQFQALPTSVGDFDGDGRIEIGVNVWNQRGDKLWHALVLDAWTGNVKQDLPGALLRGIEDITGDGRLVLMVSPENGPTPTGSYTLDIYAPTPQRLRKIGSIQTPGALATRPHTLRLNEYSNSLGRPRPDMRDADGDRRAELSWISGGRTTFYGLEGDGTLRVKQSLARPAPAEPPAHWALPLAGKTSTLAAAGLHGDGRIELLVRKDDELVALHAAPTAAGGFKELWRYKGIAPVKAGVDWYSCTALDLYGDGRRAVVVQDFAPGSVGNPHRITLLGSEGKPLRSIRFPELAQPIDHLGGWGEGDFNGDGKPELFVSMYRHAPSSTGMGVAYSVAIVDPRTGERLWTRRKISGTSWGAEVKDVECLGPTFPVVTAADLNRDGVDDVLYGCNYFNFTMLDGRNGDVIEAFHVNTIYGNDNTGYGYPRITQLGGKGRRQGWCEYNGFYGGAAAFQLDRALPLARRKLWAEAYGTSDSLYMLPARYPVYGIGDVDGDGIVEMLVPHIGGELRCHNGMTGQIKWTANVGGRPTDILVWDTDGDGKDEFAFGTDAGRIWVVKGNGRPLWSFDLPRDMGGVVSHLIAADVLGKGKPQLIANANGRVYVLDSR